jgi:2-aminoadipate transaminase
LLELPAVSGLRAIMDLALRPGVLSLAIGQPAAELFPGEALAEEAARLLRSDPSCLQYSLPSQPLKARIVELMAMRGVRCTEEQIFLTSGSQQGMDLLARLLLPPGAKVALEWAVYEGIQAAIRIWQPEILTVGSGLDTGIDVDEVEALLAGGARPAFLYVITDGHNPLGVSLGLAARHRLAELARRYRMPILEDDAYGFLYYGETPAPPLRAAEEEWVYYLGSFSKTLAPALRAGWLVVPAALTARLSALKHGADLDTPAFSHHVIAAFLESGRFPRHLAAVRAEYRRRRDAMLAALEAHFPPGVAWNHPASGMFVWAELPEGMDAAALLRVAVERERVAFCPGEVFCTGDRRCGSRCLRLSFASQPPERIEEGIRRLGRAIRDLACVKPDRRRAAARPDRDRSARRESPSRR